MKPKCLITVSHGAMQYIQATYDGPPEGALVVANHLKTHIDWNDRTKGRNFVRIWELKEEIKVDD